MVPDGGMGRVTSCYERGRGLGYTLNRIGEWVGSPTVALRGMGRVPHSSA